MNFSTPELQELDRIWPLGQQLIVPENGIIFVAGAWKGLYCRYLTERFPTAKIYGFEPQRAACREAANWTAMDKNVSIFPFGIGIEDAVMLMGDAGTDGCSVLKSTGNMTTGIFIESSMIRDWLDVESVDLAVINMEGYEYHLLEDWMKDDEINHYHSLAIQFHKELVEKPTGSRIIGEVYQGLIKNYGPTEYYDPNHPLRWTYWKKQNYAPYLTGTAWKK